MSDDEPTKVDKFDMHTVQLSVGIPDEEFKTTYRRPQLNADIHEQDEDEIA